MGNSQGLEQSSVNFRPVIELDSIRALRRSTHTHQLAEHTLGVFYLPTPETPSVIDEGIADILVDNVGFTTFMRLARLGLFKEAEHVESILRVRAVRGDGSAQLAEQANFYISQYRRDDVLRPHALPPSDAS